MHRGHPDEHKRYYAKCDYCGRKLHDTMSHKHNCIHAHVEVHIHD